MQTIDQILRAHPFFKDLKEEYLKIVTGCASNVVFKTDEIILKEGKPANHFYLIKVGLVAIEISASSNKQITIQTLGEGNMLGWSWLIPPHRNRFNCRAIENVHMIALDGKCLREKCEKNHDLGYDLLKRIARVSTQRLEATRLQLLNLYEK